MADIQKVRVDESEKSVSDAKFDESNTFCVDEEQKSSGGGAYRLSCKKRMKRMKLTHTNKKKKKSDKKRSREQGGGAGGGGGEQQLPRLPTHARVARLCFSERDDAVQELCAMAPVFAQHMLALGDEHQLFVNHMNKVVQDRNKNQLAWLFTRVYYHVSGAKCEWIYDIFDEEWDRSWTYLEKAKTWNDVLLFGQGVIQNKFVSPWYYAYFMGSGSRPKIWQVAPDLLEIGKYMWTTGGQEGEPNKRATITGFAPRAIGERLATHLNRIDGIMSAIRGINFEDITFDVNFGTFCSYVTYGEKDGVPSTQHMLADDGDALIAFENNHAHNLVDLLEENDIWMWSAVDTIYNRNILHKEILKVLRSA